jgi:RNA polymerase sigma-70 factor (ECF subfamily)
MTDRIRLQRRPIVAVRSGDEPSITFEEFFERERNRLFRMLCDVTGSRHEAEELSQEAFLRIWQRWPSVREMEAPAGYLHRTAMNLFRKRYRRASLALRRSVGLAAPRDVYEQVDDRDAIDHALRALTPRQRAAMVLTELLGYSPEEAGSILGIKASTVRALNFQGRTALRAGREAANG